MLNQIRNDFANLDETVVESLEGAEFEPNEIDYADARKNLLAYWIWQTHDDPDFESSFTIKLAEAYAEAIKAREELVDAKLYPETPQAAAA